MGVKNFTLVHPAYMSVEDNIQQDTVTQREKAEPKNSDSLSGHFECFFCETFCGPLSKNSKNN